MFQNKQPLLTVLLGLKEFFSDAVYVSGRCYLGGFTMCQKGITRYQEGVTRCQEYVTRCQEGVTTWWRGMETSRQRGLP